MDRVGLAQRRTGAVEALFAGVGRRVDADHAGTVEVRRCVVVGEGLLVLVSRRHRVDS